MKLLAANENCAFPDNGVRWAIASAIVTIGPMFNTVSHAVDRVDKPLEMRSKGSNITSADFDENDIETFIESHALSSKIETAFQLIAKYFDVAGYVAVEKTGDPEFPDEWITLRFQASGNVEAVLDSYDRFTRDFARLVPGESGRKIRVSLGVA